MENRNRTLGICALILIVSLYVVGIVSHGIVRHTVQTAPLWLAVWLGFRRSPWTKWAVLSLLVHWLLLMINIWLLLLGLPHLMSGTFAPIEIAMTITIGVASVVGIATALRGQHFRRRTFVSFVATVPAVILVHTVLVVVTVFPVLFLVVRNEIVEREAVVRVDVVHRLIGVISIGAT